MGNRSALGSPASGPVPVRNAPTTVTAAAATTSAQVGTCSRIHQERTPDADERASQRTHGQAALDWLAAGSTNDAATAPRPS